MPKNSNSIGIKVPEILLPDSHIDYSKWAVIACDQYTSQRSYWNDVKKEVGDTPSALHIIFPEVYLEDNDRDRRIADITKTMKNYLEEGVLRPLSPSFLYVERRLHSGIRKGLIVALDLEQYDYRAGSQTLIRATEGTVLDRLPPRIRIRQGAALEIPHIMVLIDDPQSTVIEPISEDLSQTDKLYDFDLMRNGGHITGYRIGDPASIQRIVDALAKLADPAAFRNKYGVGEEKGVLLFAVGDGNHSLAAAKACWEDRKKNLSAEEAADHPARFALVELVNVHEEALVFEPIHRVLFHIDPVNVIGDMKKFYDSSRQDFAYELFDSEKAMKKEYLSYEDSKSEDNRSHRIPFVFRDRWGILQIDRPKSNLEAGTLQTFLDEFLKGNPGVTVDYIHGWDTTAELGWQPGNIGFFLPAMNKDDLFKTVILDGALPRKTFSMGEAYEKRFYLECRRISV